MADNNTDPSKYKPELHAEKDSLDPSFVHALRLINQEIENVDNGEMGGGMGGRGDEIPDKRQFLTVHVDKPQRVQARVYIPVKEYPRFNFVGKILGPKGESMKQLCQLTGCRMTVLGRGSMRDKEKEEAMRCDGDPKNKHLNDQLHVLVDVYAPPAEAYGRVAHGLSELKKILQPVHDDNIQMNGEFSDAPSRPRGRGGPPRGSPNSRGPPRGGSGPRGSGSPRGGSSSRPPLVRGRGAPSRGGPPSRPRAPPPAPVPQSDLYGSYDTQSYDSYGADPYSVDTSYEYSYGGDQAYDGGYGTGYSGQDWGAVGLKAQSSRAPPRARDHPYQRY